MKKLLIVLAFVAAFCITEKAQAQLNLHVDYAPEWMNTYTPTHDTTLFYHGLSVGLSWTFDLTSNLSLTAGAQYRMSLRDASEHYWSGSIFVHDVYRERQSLIDVPILLKYNIPHDGKVAIAPFVGPMLSWGIEGKTTESTTYPNNTERTTAWYGDDGYLKRFNVYGMAGVEFCFHRVTISLGGRYGFFDLNKNNTGTVTKAYGVFTSIGHNF